VERAHDADEDTEFFGPIVVGLGDGFNDVPFRGRGGGMLLRNRMCVCGAVRGPVCRFASECGRAFCFFGFCGDFCLGIRVGDEIGGAIFSAGKDGVEGHENEGDRQHKGYQALDSDGHLVRAKSSNDVYAKGGKKRSDFGRATRSDKRGP